VTQLNPVLSEVEGSFGCDTLMWPQRIFMNQADFAELIPDCCRIRFASIERYEEDEKRQIEVFLPGAKTDAGVIL
jgi:hypothetical protein